jgi:hypothetical protein
MMAKQEVAKLKATDTEKLEAILSGPNSNGNLLSVLENLGYLPKNFNGRVLLPLLKHENAKVRLLAAKKRLAATRKALYFIGLPILPYFANLTL